MARGKLIVIDGVDGSGKATQTQLLVERMRQEGLAVETVSFPQYGSKSASPVEEYLSGKYGSAEEVSAYQASLLFAVDRFDAARRIQSMLDAGSHVIADRYVGSNMGHQGAKISDSNERRQFFAWNLQLEHEILGIPRPALNVILHIPVQITMMLAKERGGWKGDMKTDIHETNAAHLTAAEQTYLELAATDPGFQLIECTENENLLSKEEIHQRVWSLVKQIISS